MIFENDIFKAHEKTIEARDNLIERMLEKIKNSEIEIAEIQTRHNLEIDKLKSQYSTKVIEIEKESEAKSVQSKNDFEKTIKELLQKIELMKKNQNTKEEEHTKEINRIMKEKEVEISTIKDQRNTGGKFSASFSFCILSFHIKIFNSFP